MTQDVEHDPNAPGVVLATYLSGCIARAYDGLVPMDDVMVAGTAVLMDFLGRVDQQTADGYRAFIIERLMEGASRQ